LGGIAVLLAGLIFFYAAACYDHHNYYRVDTSDEFDKHQRRSPLKATELLV
jgi:hypothetical protein